MNNPKYLAAINAGVETRVIDFKAAFSWRESTKCERFEVLKDVAAMANVGGGLLIIGRDEPTHATGSLSDDEEQSFDPTEVNKIVHRYLAPTIECRVEIEDVNGSRIAVVDVPDFDTTPLVFQEIGNCGVVGCKKSPHFKEGDLFIRTKAQQSKRISTPDEMRDLFNRGVLKTRDELVTSLQRMLTAPQSQEIPMEQSPYDAEYKREDGFFSEVFYPWQQNAGHYDMTVRALQYTANRIALHDLGRRIAEYAYVIQRRGILDSVPYEASESQNVIHGVRTRLIQPQYHRLEAVSLQQSGLYRVVRSFPEDFKPNEDRTRATFLETDKELFLDTFVETMTMFHLLARNIMRAQAADVDEEFQLDVRVDGLALRKISANRMELRTQMGPGFYAGTHVGTVNSFTFPLRTTLRAMEVECVAIARQRCQEILWTFGIQADVSLGIQRKLLRDLEPRALPL